MVTFKRIHYILLLSQVSIPEMQYSTLTCTFLTSTLTLRLNGLKGFPRGVVLESELLEINKENEWKIQVNLSDCTTCIVLYSGDTKYRISAVFCIYDAVNRSRLFTSATPISTNMITNKGLECTSWKQWTNQHVVLERLSETEIKSDDVLFTVTLTINEHFNGGGLAAKKQINEPAHFESQSLSEDFGSLLLDTQSADVTFKLGKKKIVAHKAILSARSEVFRAMFRSEMKESTTNEVTLKDTDENTFRNFLTYLYTNKSESESLTASLLILADKYQIKRLVALCEQHLLTSLSIYTAVENLLFGNIHSEVIKDASLKFIANNFKAMLAADCQFLQPVAVTAPMLMQEIMVAMADGK